MNVEPAAADSVFGKGFLSFHRGKKTHKRIFQFKSLNNEYWVVSDKIE
jgi:hypothetical protein